MWLHKHTGTGSNLTPVLAILIKRAPVLPAGHTPVLNTPVLTAGHVPLWTEYQTQKDPTTGPTCLERPFPPPHHAQNTHTHTLVLSAVPDIITGTHS